MTEPGRIHMRTALALASVTGPEDQAPNVPPIPRVRAGLSIASSRTNSREYPSRENRTIVPSGISRTPSGVYVSGTRSLGTASPISSRVCSATSHHPFSDFIDMHSSTIRAATPSLLWAKSSGGPASSPGRCAM